MRKQAVYQSLHFFCKYRNDLVVAIMLMVNQAAADLTSFKSIYCPILFPYQELLWIHKAIL